MMKTLNYYQDVVLITADDRMQNRSMITAKGSYDFLRAIQKRRGKGKIGFTASDGGFVECTDDGIRLHHGDDEEYDDYDDYDGYTCPECGRDLDTNYCKWCSN